MDRFLILKEALNFWWLIPLALLLALFKTAWFKGHFGEFYVRALTALMLDKKLYHRMHNLMLRTPDGTTQIDQVLISSFGIFVLEIKNMQGWIFGKENERQWTQKIYEQSFRFQNPLRQNYKHIKALEKVLSVPSTALHSVIVFVGDTTFKTQMPPNVTYGSGYVPYIKSFQDHVFSESDVQRLVQQLESKRLQPSSIMYRMHVRNLKARSDPEARRLCPKCGSPLVLRTAKRGSRAGKQFWACSAYPKCRTVQNIS